MTKGQRVFHVFFMVAMAALFAWASPNALQAIYNLTVEKNRLYSANNPVSMVASGLLGLIIGGVIARVIIRLLEKMDAKWDEWDKGDRVNLIVGIFGGLIASTPVAMLLNSMNLGPYLILALFGLWIGCVAATIYALRSMGDILPWGKDRGPSRRRGIKILDTNVLIDGRIYDVARTGFLEGNLYVPGFVLDELQHIADSHDPLRRQRGRRGLDVLRMLQADYPTEVRVHDKLSPDVGDEVDARLVRLARAMGADIVTNDFNLNRVASLQQVKVLNLNDLALSLKPNVLPSEVLRLAVIREGNQYGQGIGYLEDGTMVVIENGKNHIGENVDVHVTQVIQTERGKMIFAEIRDEVPDSQNGLQSGHEAKPRVQKKRV